MRTLVSCCLAAFAAHAHAAEVVSKAIPPVARSPDYARAVAMPLPEAPQVDLQGAIIGARTALDRLAAEPATPAEMKSTPGAVGDGRRIREVLFKPDAGKKRQPFQFGTGERPFSTARADLMVSATKELATNETYPYRASGKLFFVKPDGFTYVCSGSLIGPGLMVTAAHCVSEFGANQYYAEFSFVPGYRGGVAPYGKWAAEKVFVLSSYLDGTDLCKVQGVVCENDIAVVLLKKRPSVIDGTPIHPGGRTGWYSYPRTDLFGFTGAGLTHVTQIGYPVCMDDGQRMQRTDSHGMVSAADSGNTLIGSLMCGGSSGGGWFINFGIAPALTATTAGTAPDSNMIIGVTSWGFKSTAVKYQGASPFRVANLVKLVDAACAEMPDACR